MVCAKLIAFTGNFTLRLSKALGDLRDFSFILDVINENLLEWGFWWFSFNGTSSIFDHDRETMSLRFTRQQTNSHIHMLTHKFVDETPGIDSDHKDFLLFCQTEVLPVKEKNGIYISVYLHTTDTTFVGVSFGVLSSLR